MKPFGSRVLPDFAHPFAMAPDYNLNTVNSTSLRTVNTRDDASIIADLQVVRQGDVAVTEDAVVEASNPVEDKEKSINLAGQSKTDDSSTYQTKTGTKFENCVRSLVEPMRRYILIQGFANTYPSPFPGQSIYEYAVRPYTPLAYYFAGWSGSIKFRIFSPGDEATPVAFIPYVDKWQSTIPLAQRHNVPAPAIGGSQQVTDTSNITVEFKSFGINSNIPYEMKYPISGTNWIDVNIPFATHYTYMVNPAYRSEYQTTGESIGSLLVVSKTGKEPIIMTAVGDDFTPGIKRPIFAQYKPIYEWAGGVTTSDAYRVCGYTFGPNFKTI